MNELFEWRQQGLSIQAISELSGYDRKTVRKYLCHPEAPAYGPRDPAPSKLDPFKPYLNQRLAAGVWNAQVLLGEIRQQGYRGSYTLLKQWLQPQRAAARAVAVRRFETPPGQQAQADWGHLGSLFAEGRTQRPWGFALTLGYSRRLWAQAALDQTLPTLLGLHESAFQRWGAVPQEILYDRMRTVWLGSDERGEIVWHPVFADFARYWGFCPRLCRPYRAQTKGKIESGIKYLRRNFLCGLLGREPACLDDFNRQLDEWVEGAANQRVHGTTGEAVSARWESERLGMQPLDGRPAYPYRQDELRQVARDAYVSWQASRYSVPWRFAGKQVWVRERGPELEVYDGGERIAVHARTAERHRVITNPLHHQGIPGGPQRAPAKTLIEIHETAPQVQTRPLAAYQSLAGLGGGQ